VCKAAIPFRRFLAFVSFTWFIGEPVTEHMPYLRRCRLAMISSKVEAFYFVLQAYMVEWLS